MKWDEEAGLGGLSAMTTIANAAWAGGFSIRHTGVGGRGRTKVCECIPRDLRGTLNCG
jgi:hypothetical protein